MKIYNRVLVWLVLIIAMCAVSVYFGWDIKGLYNRTFNVPELVTAISYADLEGCD